MNKHISVGERKPEINALDWIHSNLYLRVKEKKIVFPRLLGIQEDMNNLGIRSNYQSPSITNSMGTNRRGVRSSSSR